MPRPIQISVSMSIDPEDQRLYKTTSVLMDTGEVYEYAEGWGGHSEWMKLPPGPWMEEKAGK